MTPTIPGPQVESTTLQSTNPQSQSASSAARSKVLDTTDLAVPVPAAGPSHGVQVGAPNDVDAASTTVTPGGPTGARNARTGTLPFMAHELLSKEVWQGHVQHAYAHDAEAFIWVLTWVCLHYDAGVPRARRRLDGWLKGGAFECMKMNELLLRHYAADGLPSEEFMPGLGHEKSWLVAKRGLGALEQQMSSPTPSDEACDGAFQRLLESSLKAACENKEEETSHDGDQAEKGNEE